MDSLASTPSTSGLFHSKPQPSITLLVEISRSELVLELESQFGTKAPASNRAQSGAGGLPAILRNS